MIFDAPTFVAFALASLVVILTPGPDLLYIMSRSVGQGRVAGVVAACGTASGLAVHATAAALGLSSIFAYSPLAYDLIRYVGVAYLLYLAYRAFAARDEPAAARIAAGRQPDLARVFRQATVTNLLNPKVALFFIAFLPQFADPRQGSVALQILVLGAFYIVAGFAFCVAVALAFGAAGDWLLRRPAFRRAQRWLMGTVLGGLALWLALPERR
jgi:threonine/homoserine/homoserine lactone efflux protein